MLVACARVDATLRQPDMLRAASRARGGASRLLSTTKKMSPEAVDAAINEMNAEMAELFGPATSFDPRVSEASTSMDSLVSNAAGSSSVHGDPFGADSALSAELDAYVEAHRAAMGPPDAAAVLRSELPTHAAQPMPTPLPVPDPQLVSGGRSHRPDVDVERAAAMARAELCGKMEAFSAELASTTDVESAGKLAQGVSACAAALAQVCALQRVNDPPQTG